MGKDVAVALGYAKSRNALAVHVDEDDKKDALIQGLLYTYPQAKVYGHRDFDSCKACPCFDARAEYV